jgi:hypothetical protein
VYAIQENAVFDTISDENLADWRICEAGGTWHRLGSAVCSQKFNTQKFSRNFVTKETSKFVSFKGNYSVSF